MIEKMKYINIINNLDNIDIAIDKYILKYDIHLEEASKEYKNCENFKNINKYTEYYKKIKKIVDVTDLNTDVFNNIDEKNAIEIIEKINSFFSERDKEIEILEKRKNNLEDIIKNLKYFINLDFNMEDISKFNFIKFKFGKIPINNFKQFKLYLYNNTNIVFVESIRDKKNIYCICFYSENSNNNNIKIILNSLNFENINMPFEIDNIKLKGTPKEIYKKLEETIEKNKSKIDKLYKKNLLESKISKEDIINAYNKIKKLYFIFDIKKYLAKISDKFCIFVGWVSEKELKKLEREIIDDDKVILKIEDDKNLSNYKPPTKLTNKFLFKPFEFFVKTYGIPKYNEIDPTPFLAITYTLIFGMMFGDFGQGLVISILGFIFYKYKKIETSLIMIIIGFSSMIFGILYGSVFGFEDVIPALWIKPSENINNILLVTVFLGIILTVLSMILNVINALKENNKIRLLLSANGVVGIIFYIGSIITIITFLSKNMFLFKILFVIFVIIPMIIIALKDYIIKKFKPIKRNVKENKIMVFIETIIKLFEILLTYFTNTLSFVRIGAFALSHASIMSVILLLAENDRGYNPIIIVLGNILVIFVESVIVGIQVLRIEFYEMFSRYYIGGGKEFEPYNKKIKDNEIDI